MEREDTDLKKATEMLLEDLNGVFYSNAPVLDNVAIEKKLSEQAVKTFENLKNKID